MISVNFKVKIKIKLLVRDRLESFIYNMYLKKVKVIFKVKIKVLSLG